MDLGVGLKRCPVFVWSSNDGSLPELLPENAAQQFLSAKDLTNIALLSDSPFWLHFAPSPILLPSSANGIRLHFWPNHKLLGASLKNSSSQHKGSMRHYEAINSLTDEHSALSVGEYPQDINGFLRLNGRTFALGVLPDNSGTFYLVPDHPGNSCEWPSSAKDIGLSRTKRDGEGHQISAPSIGKSPKMPEYYAEYIDGKRRYVELVFIADNSVYKKYESNEQRVHDRLQSIASAVNSLYAPLNIRVALVWADIWREANAPIEVTEEADKTLRDFLGFRKKVLAEHGHDNAQLLTDVRFGAVIGKAYKGTMCSFEFSGGVIVDHAELPAFVGLTVAHEMGHNFGMDHDAGYPEPCKCPAQQCIMAPASSNVNATSFFSDCSLDTLSSGFRRGVDYCLNNVPNAVFGGAKCGNGILEEGEQCDCGSTESCPNRCCVAAECKLAKGAECADGECCDLEQCKPKGRSTVCREEANECDLPEYCDGTNPICPPDFFVQDGHTCPKNLEDFCYQGVCGSREGQCRFIWGPTAKNSIAECYAYNEYGSFSGNCGYDQTKDQYHRCKKSDVTCGRLQCQHESERPVFGDPSTVYAAYNFVRDTAGHDVQCRVVRTTMTGVGKKRAVDPGMVPNGARCGKDKLCVDAQCRNASDVLQMVSKCQPEDCNGKGICNNMGNCHCVSGYGGVACDLPGPGGSVNSGPAGGHVFNPGLALLYLLVVTFVLFSLASIYCRRKRGFWLHKKIWYKLRVSLELRSFRLEPTRKAPPPPPGTSSVLHMHRHSLNAVWGDDVAGAGGASRVEVLRVDATKPYIMGGSRAAVLKVAESQQKQPSNFVPSSTSNVQYFNNVTAFQQMATKPAKKGNNGTRGGVVPSLAEQRSLVAHPGYDTGGSTSSDEQQPTRTTVADQRAQQQHEQQTYDHQHRYGVETPPPPLPPHKNVHKSGEKAVQQKQPKMPTKPPTIKAKEEKGGAEAKINVKAMAAKFEKK
ncbi:hypothetical protein niasHS_017172 [Heterodera schachtii]|uniref:Uncharacterized protein n=1 Tax=Heterodera schachtii TaxID=97005 RepID=A0ABD2I8U1_HETSC